MRGVVAVFVSLFLLLSWTPFAHSQWTVVNLPSVSSDWSLWSVSFADPARGWAVGNDTSNMRGALLAYSGGNWSAVNPGYMSPNWALFGIHLTPSDDGWAVGRDFGNNRGALLRLQNGAWESVIPHAVSSDWALFDIHLFSLTQGWAVGADFSNKTGLILRLDGSWSSAGPLPYSGTDWYLVGVHFISPDEGWVVGADNYVGTLYTGLLIHYTNGSWKTVSPPKVGPNWLLNGVFFTSSSNGWAVGADEKGGIILHYTQGAWNSVVLPNVSSSWYLMAVYFTSSSEGWAVGYDQANKRGLLLHYLNETWISVAPPQVSSDWELRDVHFTSPDQGWAVGWDSANRKGIILRYSAPETITTPDISTGPASGNINTSYTYLTGGAVSSKGDPVQYRFDWGDGTLSGWMPVGQTSTNKSWTKQGTYGVKSQARCNLHPNVLSDWSEEISVDISGTYFPITLISPEVGAAFDSCSLYLLPDFVWQGGEAFKSYELQFSPEEGFGKISTKVKSTVSSAVVTPSVWKKALLLPGNAGGTAYWRVLGTRADKTTALSEVFSFVVDATRPVQNPNISSTRRSELPLVTWGNACNIKFKAWFGSADFKKKTSLSFSVKNPTENEGLFQVPLTSRQWETIRKLVGDESGERIYWYVEASDGLGRNSTTATMNFVFSD